MKMKQKETNVDRLAKFFIDKLSNGELPWRKTWGYDSPPRNLATGNIYSGINAIRLLCNDHSSPFYLTFNQVKNLGGKVNKSSVGYPVFYFKEEESSGLTEDEVYVKTIINWYNVFNAEQIEGIDFPETPIKNPRMESLLGQMPNPPKVVEQKSDFACYSETDDTIFLPLIETFIGTGEYYTVKAHEYIHSTAHPSRLNNTFLYSFGELVAEFGAALLCLMGGVSNKRTLDNSANYINDWLGLLNEDPFQIIKAGSQAQKAVDYITPLEFERRVKK